MPPTSAPKKTKPTSTLLPVSNRAVELEHSLRPLSNAIPENGHLDAVQILLQNNADSSAADSVSNVPECCVFTAFCTSSVVMQYLRGFTLFRFSRTHTCICSQRQNGRTALHIAASLGYVNIISALLVNGDASATLEVKEKRSGNNPLHCASLGNHVPAVRLLVERGAHIDATNYVRTQRVTCSG